MLTLKSNDKLIHYRYHSGDDRIKGRIILDLHQKYMGRFKLSKYFDPKKSRTDDDFKQIALIAVKEALESFDPQRGPLSYWVVDQVRCALAREVKKITRELTPQMSFEDTFEGDDSGKSDLIMARVDKDRHFNLVNPDRADVLYKEFVDRVKFVLRTQPRLYKLFAMKLCYPHFTNRKLAGMVGMSFSALSQEMQKIKLAIGVVADEHTESYEDHGL